MTAPTYRTIAGDTADAICHRVFGQTEKLTEALLEANPGLADRGAILPAGLELKLPPAPTSEAARPVRLWD